jgi:hypothetical protein
MPSSTNFDGMSYSGYVPPHVSGDVGPAHYVQAVNVQIAVYEKTGTPALASVTLNTLWDGAGGETPCVGNDPDPLYHRGDPAVLYDHLDDRWIIADTAWADVDGPYYICMLVSKTGNPVSGGWWRYAFSAGPNILYAPSSPELGLWPSGIYMANDLLDLPAETPSGAQVWALNRDDLAVGAPTDPQTQTVAGVSYSGLLPANFRGVQPPAGRPNYFVARDPSTAALDIWRYHVDWTTNPATATFSVDPTQVTIASHAAVPALVPQMNGEGEDLQSQGDRLMPQNQYRNIAGVESLWLTHAVGDGGNPNLAGIRWYQLDVTGDSIDAAPAQYGEFFGDPADTDYRWIPSLAVDRRGNMAVGYSVSSSGMYPEIRYAGRLITDSPGTLGQGEATLVAGTGAQTGVGGAWGTHSSMTIDPGGCAFWYTNMYYATTGSSWKTRIGFFEMPSCHLFADVPVTGKEWMEPWIEAFYYAGITTGCGNPPLIYCPENQVTRAEMAVFLLRAKHGAGYVPPAASDYFDDVPVAGKEWMLPWIDEYYREGLTTGCGHGPLIFCPENNVTRAEMAVFVLRAIHDMGWAPPPLSHFFTDMPVTGKEWMEPWVDEFYREGITTGCGGGNFCPENGVTRAEMAVFIDRAYHLFP